MPEPKPYASVLKLLTAVIVCGGLFAGSAAHAQSEKDRIARLEQQIQALQKQLGKIAPGAVAAETSFQDNASDITVRLLALERSVEQLTGQVEEARFNGQRSARQLETLQDDVSLRLARIEQSLGLSGVPGAAPAALPPPQTQGQTLVPAPEAQTASVPPPAVTPTAPTTLASTTASRRLPDEINPEGPLSQPVASQPAARPLTPPAPVASSGAGSPEGVDSSGGFVIRTDAQGRPLPPDPNAPQASAPAAPEPPPQQAVPNAAPGPGPVTSGQIALGPAAVVRLPEGTPKAQYEFAFDFLKRQDYPRAESALREFLQKHPKDPLAGNAQYWLGETYYVRGDFQQAAVEFLSGYQKYPRSNKGPDNLLKLGIAMSKLNQTPGACTALGRLAKDYPDADQTVLKSAKAEFARLKCKA
jgi:tol-pal system protein YbgF